MWGLESAELLLSKYSSLSTQHGWNWYPSRRNPCPYFPLRRPQPALPIRRGFKRQTFTQGLGRVGEQETGESEDLLAGQRWCCRLLRGSCSRGVPAGGGGHLQAEGHEHLYPFKEPGRLLGSWAHRGLRAFYFSKWLSCASKIQLEFQERHNTGCRPSCQSDFIRPISPPLLLHQLHLPHLRVHLRGHWRLEPRSAGVPQLRRFGRLGGTQCLDHNPGVCQGEGGKGAKEGGEKNDTKILKI